jgi:unsaturated chondroitin disaccharide hydrolase
LLAVIAASIRPNPAMADDSFDSMVQNDWAFAAQQLNNTTGRISKTQYPITTDSAGAWKLTSASQWTSGFFPGALWMMYQQTGDSAWRTKAQDWQAAIENEKTRTNTHDLGFMLFNSFGNGYRLTGNDTYRQIVLTAADSLAGRYNDKVGMIRSWGSKDDTTDFRVIMDNMINLEMLMWASKHGGSQELATKAINHALRTKNDFIRSDGSSYHLVYYDQTTGGVIRKTTAQGAGPETTWARGQAWGIYGFTMMYRETGDQRFLDAARQLSDYFVANLPADYVPYWDFKAPNIPNEPRDSSAAAIASSGLLELWRLETDATRKTTYATAAKNMLTSLSSTNYLAKGTNNQAILLHGTYHKPANDYDTGTTWGDYYFLEALLRLRWLPPDGTALNVREVIASGDNGNVPANTLDNNLATFWSAEGDGQWIRYDLGGAQTVTKLHIALNKGDKRTARFEIQLSTDGTNWTKVWSGVASGTTLQQETYDFADRSARYVRFVGHMNTENTWNSITELDIYGIATAPTPTPTPQPTGVFQEQNGLLVMEAENYTGIVNRSNQSWVKRTDIAGYVGSGFMRPEPDNNVTIDTSYTTKSPEMSYKVQITKTGKYYIWLRGYAQNSDSNTVHLGLDGQAFASSDKVATGSYGSWLWLSGSLDSGVTFLEINSAGAHTINVWMREDGFRLDRIVLTTDSKYKPSGNGPAESPRK